ncbi:MAG: ABC transporter ATP-binding protein, partial [Gammaproteobacteria bacterium]|nr:ABC transporter ATP-binding protein [Gammaproteobacteria bacterium]
MIFQDPVGSFNPVKTIGWHFVQVGRRAGEATFDKAENRRLAVESLKQAGIPHADDVLRLYPHQLSGGMLQRCLIALVLFLKPSLIVADEPTTNLDNIVERQIIDLFAQLQDEIDAGFIFITHDMTIAERVCDDIAVMYAGQVVETAPAGAVLSRPVHPYSQGLIRTARELDAGVEELTEIPGDLSGWQASPHRCRFGARCPHQTADCDRPIGLTALETHGAVRCVLAEQAGSAP